MDTSITDETPEPVKRFLSGLQTGDWTGIEAPRVDRPHPWRLTELNVERCQSGTVVVDFEARWDETGSEEACRMANIFRFGRDGRIAEHRLYCCGEWEPETVRHVDASAPRVLR